MADAMMADAAADTPAPRLGALDGRHAGTAMVRVLPAAPAARVSLRADADALPAIEAALGMALPRRIGSSATEGLRSALCLGPDEWLLIEEWGADALRDAATSLNPIADDLAGVDAPHSAVDVSHRNTALLAAGPLAADAIEHGCPRDLSLDAFPVGACARTVLGKAEVVLWRGQEDAFRIECWRSFSTYAMDFMAEAARDASA